MKTIISYENPEIKNKLKKDKERNQSFILEKILGRKEVITHVNSYGKIGEDDNRLDGFRGYYLGTKEQCGKIVPIITRRGLCQYQGDIREKKDNLFNSRVRIREIEEGNWMCVNFDIVIPTQFYDNEKLSKKTFTRDSRENSNTNITLLAPKNGDTQEILKTMRKNPEIFLEFYRFVLPEQFKAYEEIRDYRNSREYFDMIKNKFNEENVRKKVEYNLDFFKKGIERYLEEEQYIKKRADKIKRKKSILRFFGMKSFKKYAEWNERENRLSKSLEDNGKTIKDFENFKKESEKDLETLKNSPEEFLEKYQDNIIKRDYPEFMIKEFDLEGKNEKIKR